MRILGIDYGQKKIGLALGDTEIKVASPLEVWRHTGDDSEVAKRLIELIVNEDITEIVLGVPKTHEGITTKRGEVHERFGKLLKTLTLIPVIEVDESFTSKESQRLQQEYGTDVQEDALAAMLILQEYFENDDIA